MTGGCIHEGIRFVPATDRVTHVHFLSHPVVEGVLGAGHPTEVGAVRLGRQRPGEGHCGRAGHGGLAVHRLGTGSGVLQGQRWVGHPSHVDLVPRCTHVYARKKKRRVFI